MAEDPNRPPYDDLMGVDLSDLDLDHIELAEDRSSPWWRWVILLGLIGLVGFIVWLPSSDFYRHAGDSVFMALSLLATAVGLFGARWLFQWLEEAAANWRREYRPLEPPKPPSALQRWLTLLVALAGAGTLLFAVTPSDFVGSSGLSDMWYIAAGGALVVGILLGRWLLMQEHNPFKNVTPRKIQLPPWMKWVNLAVIIALSCVAIFGTDMMGSTNADIEFALGGVALVAGVFTAIWVARRFDEAEERIRRQARQRRGG